MQSPGVPIAAVTVNRYFAEQKHACLNKERKFPAGIDCIVVQGSEAGGHRGTLYETGGC